MNPVALFNLQQVCKKVHRQDEVSQIRLQYERRVTHGPLVNGITLDKVQAHLDACIAGGAKFLTGNMKGEGLFFEPTVLVDLSSETPMDNEETFGPVAALVCFEWEDKVAEKVNDVKVAEMEILNTG